MGALTLLITGATGYVGQATVAEARARGHKVVALTRNAGTLPEAWQADSGIEVLKCELAEARGLEAACDTADVVLHLAASMTNDAAAHARDTLAATERLLAAMPADGRLVLLSSIAVYDMGRVAAGDMITEASPLLEDDSPADTYARSKRVQERLVQASGLAQTILRAGAVFGPGRLWNAHVGLRIGGGVIRMGRAGQIPLVHVTTCADALVTAAEQPAQAPINLIDEDLPDRKRFLRALETGSRFGFPLNWHWLLPLGWLATRLQHEDRLPGLLRPAVLRARFLPVGYDNSRMRKVLGLRQARGFETLMHDAQGEGAA